MRILWLCNIVLPELCEEFGLRKTNIGGWLTGMWQELKKIEGLDLGICVPIIDKFRRKKGKREKIYYFSFPFQREEDISNEQERYFEEILDEFLPDIVHIWGTEYYHTWAMINACKRKGLHGHTIINIQGLLYYYAPVYDFGLSSDVIFEKVNGKSIYDEKNDFLYRAETEIKTLQDVKHVIGRTDWDKCCVMRHSNANYYTCGEILRSVFYEDKRKWCVQDCKRHSVFISQSGYPIKGLHLVLENIARLRKKYSDLKVTISGTDLRWKEGAYAQFICAEIKKYQLEDSVCFTGPLSEVEMYEQYLQANVFLSASTEENSPNSICEAMCVGTPVVASYVGGISSMISHGESGFLYPLTESYMMEYYVEKIFEDDSLAEKVSQGAQKFSRAFNNKENAIEKMMEIYCSII